MSSKSPNSPENLKDELQKQNVSIRSMLSKMERTFLPLGSTIGKYTIIDEVDRGGMAVVYKALQLDLDREVALKVMPANISINPRFLERFLSEAHAVAKLSHPNIVTIHEVSTQDNIYYLAMDYIPGDNLYYYLNHSKPKLVDVLEIVSKLADALAYAHNQKIIHRDLKLNNVIMRDRQTPMLIDFGLAKAMETDVSNITRTGEIVGSPAYMAPERLLGGEVDHRSDICSLGIMLYEMLTFKNPYLDQRSIHQTTMNVIEAAPIPPRRLVPWLPSEVEAITLKAMHPDPAKRYLSMEELRSDIMRYQKGEAVLAQPPSLGSRIKHSVRKYWPYLTIGALIVVFSFLLGLSYYIEQEKGKSHWQLIHHEKFHGKEVSSQWIVSRESKPEDSVFWMIREGALEVNSDSFSYVRLRQPYSRDLRVEVEVSTPLKDFFRAGVFIYGDSPENGYAFHINYNGQGKNGITYPGDKFLFYDYHPLKYSAGQSYTIAIERKRSAITFRLNGVLIAHQRDFFPPLGPKHQNIGFYSQGGVVRFDNLRVYQRAIPLSPSPTLIADRFWERGDFKAALEEYRGLHLDFANSDITREIVIRVPDCLVRMGRPEEALESLRRTPVSKLRDEHTQAKALFVQAMAHRRRQAHAKADSVLGIVVTRFSSDPVSDAAAVALIRSTATAIRDEDINSAETRLAALAPKLPRYARELGRLHLRVMDYHTRQGDHERALAAGREIGRLYPREEDILAKAQVGMAYLQLGRRKKAQAIDVLNQCVATHIYTEGVWDAWMLLGEIYEYDFNFTDAMTIYRKVFREAPKGTIIPWMARIKMGEVARACSYEENQDSIFAHVIEADHPFPFPRLIAEFYRGVLTESRFMGRWTMLQPHERHYLYYFAKKAVLDREMVVARVYLQEMQQFLQPSSWPYIKVYQTINNLDRF